MKLIILIAIALTSTAAFAKNKKTRGPSSTEEIGQCQGRATEAVIAAIKALSEKDISLHSVKKDYSAGNHEVYRIKLNSDESVAETSEIITVKVFDVGDACILDSIEMPMKIRYPSKK
ncbi:hypothetical protein CIK05_11405 [Bdellovibrio sp. qaytius]|nr:hypothetical protein CIK05_11405 [Bdellovibrio sp. qaytius]